MKTAFTMIELIFVIVILGILAAVAIPKLAGTRDDAKMSVMMSNIADSASELGNYAVSHAGINNDLSTMSNTIKTLVSTSQATLGNRSVVIKFDNVDCINISIVHTLTNDDLNISSIETGANNVMCQALQNNVDQTSYNLLLRGGSIVY